MNTRVIGSLPLARKLDGGELKERKTLAQEYSDYTAGNTSHEPDKSETVIVNVNSTIASVVRAMQGLSNQSQELIAILVCQMAKREGIDIRTNTL